MIKKFYLKLLMSLLLVALAVPQVMADELIVANGSATSQYAPIYGWYYDQKCKSAPNEVTVAEDGTPISDGYNRSPIPVEGTYFDTPGTYGQTIYKKSDLSLLADKNITKVKYYSNTTFNENSIGGVVLEIYLMETEISEMPYSGLTFTGSAVGEYVIQGGEKDIEFVLTEPFSYSGNKNLAVQVKVKTAKSYQSIAWIGKLDDWISYSNYGNSGARSTTLPKTTFTYEKENQPSVTEITLAEMLETGVNDTEYTISNDLAVVEIANNADYAFLTDGENWIRVEFNEENEDAFYNDYIKGGTLKGTLKGIELNPYIVATATPEAGETAVDYEIATISLDETFTLKVNQVAEILGYWNEDDGALRAYAPSYANQGQSMTVNTAWAGDNITLVDGHYYQIRSAITLKEAWNETTSGRGLKDYDFDFQNYIANALIAPSTPTGIEELNLSNVKSVRYYNLAGIESDVPFQGVNIEVITYKDGSSTSRKIMK